MPKRIGIWGFYFSRNYGDDLMCIQIGLHLKRMGYEVAAFELAPALCETYGFQPYVDIDEFVAAQDVTVLGGGNLLARASTWPDGPFAQRIADFEQACQAHDKQIIGISVGGDGQTQGPLMSEVTALLQSSQFHSTSVRLRTDLQLLASLGLDTLEYHPDILFGAATFFNLPQGHRDCIGIHLPYDVSARLIRLLHSLWRWRAFGGAKRFVAINAFPTPGGDYVPTRDSMERWHCHDPVELLEQLGRCRVIVSHKLHIGISALMQGAAFLSVNAHPKVSAHLAELGIGKQAMSVDLGSTGKQGRLHTALTAARIVLACLRIRLPPKFAPSQAVADSSGHLRFLEAQLESLNLAP